MFFELSIRLKGVAGFLSLKTLESLAHREEEVLNRLRNKEVRPTSEVINTLLRASDCIKSLLDSITTSNERDVTEHIVALENLLLNPANLIHGQLPLASPRHEDFETEPVAEEDFALAVQVPKLNPELLRDFLIECHDNLEQLDAFLVALEHEPHDQDPFDAGNHSGLDHHQRWKSVCNPPGKSFGIGSS